jgi:hypothetical protein
VDLTSWGGIHGWLGPCDLLGGHARPVDMTQVSLCRTMCDGVEPEVGREREECLPCHGVAGEWIGHMVPCALY